MNPIPKPHLCSASVRKCFGFHTLGWFACAMFACVGYAQAPRITFNVPPGDAAVSLRLLAEQSGQDIVFPAEAVKGVRTNAVRGEFTTRAAIEALVAGTPLIVLEAQPGA